jgi:DNA polymerase-3 subunit beta
MKLTVPVSDLRDALVTARYATPANPAVVAYSGVLLEAKDTQLVVTGFDGDFAVVTTVTADVTEAGRFLVQPRPLATYLATLDDNASCVITVNGGDLELTAGAGRPYRFRPVTATFPAPPTSPTAPTPVDFTRFAAALTAVRAAVSKEKPSVQLISDESGLILHATDNYRLAKSHLPEAGFGTFTGLVPLAVLDRVARAGVTAVTVDPSSRIIVFAAGATTFTTRLAASDFPAVAGILSAVPPSRHTIPAAATARALAPLAALTESSADLSPVKVTLDGSLMTLTASNADTGSGVEDVALASAIGAPFEFQVKLQYLRDALAGFSADDLVLAYSSPKQPLYLLADAPVSTTVVVMPVMG